MHVKMYPGERFLRASWASLYPGEPYTLFRSDCRQVLQVNHLAAVCQTCMLPSVLAEAMSLPSGDQANAVTSNP